MRSEFALKFEYSSVHLFNRTANGNWFMVGSAKFDDLELERSLSRLRDVACKLSFGEMSTVLVPPEAEVLYTSCRYRWGGEIARRMAIWLHLRKLTPYKFSELAYDQYRAGDELRVAVVARETLTQMTEFATKHRFNPAVAVSVPETNEFERVASFKLAIGKIPRKSYNKIDSEIENMQMTVVELPASQAAKLEAKFEEVSKRQLD